MGQVYKGHDTRRIVHVLQTRLSAATLTETIEPLALRYTPEEGYVEATSSGHLAGRFRTGPGAARDRGPHPHRKDVRRDGPLHSHRGCRVGGWPDPLV